MLIDNIAQSRSVMMTIDR